MRWFVVVALALVLSACGDSGEGPGVASAGGPGTTTGTSVAPDAQAFTECMRDNGIDLPDPDPETGEPVIDRSLAGTEEFTKAMEACEALMPAGQWQSDDPEDLDKYQAFADCMRENGFPDFPDPQPGGPDGLFPGIGAQRGDPAFATASEKCGHLLEGS